jgi:hypothetical protein
MPYIANNQFYTYGKKTLTQIDSITGMATGDTVYCTDHNRVFTYENDWMCSDFIRLVNRSGAARSRWDIVVAEEGGTTTEVAASVETTTLDTGRVLGVVVFGGNNGDPIVVAVKGNYKVNVDEAIALGDELTVSSTSGQAQTNAGTYSGGVFGFALSSSGGAGTVDVLIMPRKEIF